MFTLLFLKFIASRHVTSEPCDAQRRTAGHPGEGRSLEVVKTCYIHVVKSLFHLEIVSSVITFEPSHPVL